MLARRSLSNHCGRLQHGAILPPSLILVVLLVLPQLASALPDTDVLIVGAGTSGCVLAARLCATLPTVRITLLERAQPRSAASDFTVRTPRSAFDTLADPQLAEFIPPEPEPSLANRVLPVATGATLGGSSSVNGMQFFAPLFGDVAKWRVRALTEFNVAKYILRAFKQLGAAPQQGELRQLYVDQLLQAGNSAGFTPDFGPLDRRVASTIFENRVTVNSSGVRQDSCTAYLTPVQHSACANNLHLVQGITVTRVLFEKRRWYSRKLHAYGAEYVYSNDTDAINRMVIRARRRVILAAGPFGSPKLLQLSGIGPRDVLKQANIPLLKRLAVGAQTQTRALIGILSSYSEQLPLDPVANETAALSPESVNRWRTGNGGPLGAGVGAINGRLLRDAYFIGSFVVPLLFRSPNVVNEPRLLALYCLSNPTSFGSLQVRDSNPFTALKLRLGILTRRVEFLRTKRCLQRMVDIQRAFASEFELRVVFPADGEITREFIEQGTTFAYHYVGGSAVGSVLNSRLMVKGTTGLYVVDASALRRMTSSAGPLASVYTLAEFMAERFVYDLRR